MNAIPQRGKKYVALPRTLTKKAIKSVLGIRNRGQWRKILTPEIIRKMGLDKESHARIREYDIHQTQIIIVELQLEEEDLLEMSRFM